MTQTSTRVLISYLLAAVSVAAQPNTGNNLIVNGDAEAGTAISTREQAIITDLPGWTRSGSLTAAQYTGGDGFLGSDTYGPLDRGANYFIGGPGGKATAAQTIDLSASAAEIDLGKVKFYLAGYLGAAGPPATPFPFKATFKDAKGAVLLTASITGPAAGEMGAAALVSRATSGFLLPNTRSVDLLLDLSGPAGDFNSYAADNLSLVLTVEPVIGVNLVVNGDAESSPGRDGKVGPQLPVPGWSGSIYIESVPYEDMRLPEDAELPANRGKNLFSTSGSRTVRLSQLIDVTLARDLIDAGRVTFSLSANLGGFDTDSSTATVTGEFLDASGKTLLTKPLGPIGEKERGGKTQFFAPASSGAVPNGTRILRVTLEFANLSNGGYQVVADNISLTLNTTAAAVTIKDGGIVHAASGQAGPLAPGEMVTLYMTGVNVSAVARMQLDSTGRVANELAGVKVFFDGTQAPVLYVSSSQIGVIVPFDVASKSTVQVRVEYQGVKSNVVPMSIVKTAPGIFTQDTTGKGAGQIYNEGFLLNSTANPAVKGSVVTIIWSGGGQTDPAGVDGRMETQSLPKPVAAVSVKIGGQTAEVVYAGAVPYSWAGLLQAQVKVPAAAASGNAIPVVLTAGSTTSPDGVTIAVK